jgi:hypothetical protein
MKRITHVRQYKKTINGKRIEVKKHDRKVGASDRKVKKELELYAEVEATTSSLPAPLNNLGNLKVGGNFKKSF